MSCRESSQNVILYLLFFIRLLQLGFYTLYVYLSKFIMLIVPPPPKSLKGEVILVTGGANGIGRQICLQLVKYETQLTLISWDVDEEENRALVNELKQLGVRKAYACSVDVGNENSVHLAAIKTREEVGDVTILFNNAGIAGDIGECWKIHPRVMRQVFDTNLLSHCWTLREFLPNMIRRKKGHIIATCSIMAFGYGKNGSSYTSTKSAMHGYMECLKEDLRSLPERHRIFVSVAYPHNTVTQLTAKARLHSKSYPFLMPQLDATYVASKIVFGMLRNQEHIYAPGYLRLYHSILPILPPETLRRCVDIADVQPSHL